jgi:hypothetical protein
VHEPVGEFQHIVLTKDDRAGALQHRVDAGVVVGDVVLHNARTYGGPDPVGHEYVLYRDGNAGQLARGFPLREEILRFFSLFPRLLGKHSDEGVEPRFELLEPFQYGFENLDRRDFPLLVQ